MTATSPQTNVVADRRAIPVSEPRFGGVLWRIRVSPAR
jgi:hypothetical protein